MKDTQPADMTSLKQHFSSWRPDSTALFTGTRLGHRDHDETLRKPPAPSAFDEPEILSHLRPDPMLLVTPEKSLGLAALDRNNCSLTETEASRPGEEGRRGRQKVRFAPGTVTSPPSRPGDGGRVGGGHHDDDSVPRSFSSLTQKLYQPARYADIDEGRGAHTPVSSACAPQPYSVETLGQSACAPQPYSVETLGQSAVCVPMVKNTASDSCGQHGNKTAAGRVKRHKPAVAAGHSHGEGGGGASDTEVKETLRHTSPSRRSPMVICRSHRTSPLRSHQSSPHLATRSHSTSPLRSHRSSPHLATRSPSSSRSSPARSPGRLTPVTVSGPDLVFFTDLVITDQPDPPVRVVREAPLRPKLSDYVFPFRAEEGGPTDNPLARPEFNSTVKMASDNPLARPEFNSTVKMGQELRAAKAKRSDTWGAVNNTLKTSHRKRTQIQEKASSKVNMELQWEVYSDLVEVDVPLDDLCHDLEHRVALKAPASKPAHGKVPVGREPDLMEFFVPDIQQELPHLTLTGIQPITENLSTANPLLAFDLYRHNRSWDGLADS
ncbi:uncharacterized protein [Littorina saxatilis]|uniref:uncharacterized protein n=1 Tax=Littorina saxatilis TaxID=31220 RepID=UPI0038B6A5D5